MNAQPSLPFSGGIAPSISSCRSRSCFGFVGAPEEQPPFLDEWAKVSGELDRIREVTGHHRLDRRCGSVGEDVVAALVVVGTDDVLVVHEIGHGVAVGQLLVDRRQVDGTRVPEQLWR